MKTIFTFLILISSLISFSQSESVVGDYTLKHGTVEKDLLEYKLTISQDGTFYFHYYSNLKHVIPPESNKYGKGKWIIENNVISFFSDKQNDLDEKYTLDFTDSKARFVTKSPRDKTDRLIKIRLKFLKSEISWMKTIELFKI